MTVPERSAANPSRSCKTKVKKEPKATTTTEVRTVSANNNRKQTTWKKKKRGSSKSHDSFSASKKELEKFREELSSSSVPSDLPCRNEQFETIYRFIENNLETKTSRTLYISGVPGTGKTATVHKVVQQLLKLAKKTLAFDYVEVNGMRLVDPHQVYAEIYRQLVEDRKIGASAALSKLSILFTEGDVYKRPTVLLVDELDLLCTRRQNVLYQLFEWATRDAARLTILAIANTLDLPERLLSHRVSSRMGMSRLPFQPYGHKEIEEILQSRLLGCDCVEEDAVELVSRKVAAVSGDLRKALEIFRRAADIALQKDTHQLTIREVQEAVKDLANTTRLEAVRNSSFHENLVLQAVVSEYQRTGNEETSFSALSHSYRDLCRLDSNRGVRILGTEELVAVCASLTNSSLLVPCPGLSEWTRRYRLGMPVDDMLFALNIDKKL